MNEFKKSTIVVRFFVFFSRLISGGSSSCERNPGDIAPIKDRTIIRGLPQVSIRDATGGDPRE